MTEKEKGALQLASLGALVVSVSLFAETFGLGSRNGEFGRWQMGGVLSGSCLLLYALFLAMPIPGFVRQVKRRIVKVSVVVAAIAAAAVFTRWALPPSPYPDANWSRPTGTCIYYAEDGCLLGG